MNWGSHQIVYPRRVIAQDQIFELLSVTQVPYSPHLYFSQITAITYEEVKAPFNQFQILEAMRNRARSLATPGNGLWEDLDLTAQSPCSSSLRQGAPESWLGFLECPTAQVRHGPPKNMRNDSFFHEYTLYFSALKRSKVSFRI